MSGPGPITFGTWQHSFHPKALNRPPLPSFQSRDRTFSALLSWFRPSLSSRLTLFSWLTAWANLLHQLSYPEWIKGLHSIGWLLFVFSLAGLVRPSSFLIFISLMVFRVLYTVSWIPMIRGHLFLEGLFTVGILIILTIALFRLGRPRPANLEEEEELFESFAPMLRATTLVVYGAVTLSKLNVEFLDLEKSAAVQLLHWTQAQHPFLPRGPWTWQLSIWGTLAIECAIPVLLCWRRTRWLGLVLGLIFHTLLGLLPLKIASFSATMMLLLFTWLPRGSPAVIHQAMERCARSLRLAPERLLLLATCLAFATGFAFAFRHGTRADPHAIDLGLGLWAWQTAAAAGALWALRKQVFESTLQLLRTDSWLSWTCVGILVLNCASPYIGLKTRTSLSMHCNLRTEKGHWNHLFLPESLRIFPFQDDLIVVLESDQPDLDHLRATGMPIPYFEFRRWCRLAPDTFFVRYRRGDQPEQRFEKRSGAASDASLVERAPVLEWLLCFNPVGASHDYMPGFVSRVGPARNVVPVHRSQQTPPP